MANLRGEKEKVLWLLFKEQDKNTLLSSLKLNYHCKFIL